MKGKENIEELFKKGLENYQPEVNPSLWDNIQSQMQPGNTPSTPNDGGGSSSVVQTMLHSTKFWVATSIVAVATVTTVLIVNNTESETQNSEKQNQELVENTDKNESLSENETINSTDNSENTVSEEVENNSSDNSEVEESTNASNVETNNGSESGQTQDVNNNSSNTEGSTQPPVTNDPKPDTGGKENQSGDTNGQPNNSEKNPEKKDENLNNDAGEIDKSVNILSKQDQYLINESNQFYVEENADILTVVWYVDGKFEGTGFDKEITFDSEGDKLIEAEITFADETTKQISKSVSVTPVSYLGGFSNNEPLKGKGSFPNVITPNGDGDNDYLEFQYGNIESFNLIILNKNGQMVYGSESPDFKWNGTDRSGNPLKDTEFKYMIKATGKDGKVYNIKESLTIKR